MDNPNHYYYYYYFFFPLFFIQLIFYITLCQYIYITCKKTEERYFYLLFDNHKISKYVTFYH